jgi:glutamate formiminotransferase/formiminotetrahydrofolate cyclodeaminase
MPPLIECVPNFSEGRDAAVIRQITDAIDGVEGVRLLNVDPGHATNRTVVTFVGRPDAVIEAAFQGIRTAAALIDMRTHRGEHPRMGATDVCPLIPVSGIAMEDTVEYARRLADRVGRELTIPVYLYEAAQPDPARRNLAAIRAGEYEGLARKIVTPEWKPDFGPAAFNPNAIAFDVREAGRTVTDAAGHDVVQPGTLKAVKAIGWYIAEYGIAQVSMNLTNLNATPLHVAFDEVCRAAARRGIRVTGSELVGLVPLQCLLDAGRYFLEKQQRSTGVSERELVRIAVRSLGLDDLAPFKPEERVIEYLLKDPAESQLAGMSLANFMDETASESPAPGGGSIAAYVGALGAALGTMVANLSSHKRGWDERWKGFSDFAEQGQRYAQQLLRLVDEDTRAFTRVMAAMALPKATEEDKVARKSAIQEATRAATAVPFKVMETAFASMAVIKQMAEIGQESSVSDAGVGALCARTAVMGAFLNVRINATQLTDRGFADDIVARGARLEQQAQALEATILGIVNQKL